MESKAGDIMSFTHLQIRSGYSLMNSTITIDRLMQKAQQLELEALALTDEHVMYGVIPFYQACKKAGIKPIIGMTTFITAGEEQISTILLAKNNKGYESLIKISTYIQLREQKHVSLEVIQHYADEIICILPVDQHVFRQSLLTDSFQTILDKLKPWLECFGKEHVYLGVKPEKEDSSLFTIVKSFSGQYKFRACALSDVRYLEENGVLGYDCLQSMKNGKQWNGRETDSGLYGKHLRSPAEMNILFANWPEVLEKTEQIAQICNVTIDFDQRFIPSFPTPEEMDADMYLEQLCKQALPRKYETVTKEINERLTYELDVIRSMNFSDYFLIVSDFIAYAKQHNILVGPGRGSSAGSIVAYLLGITNVDPIRYHLLFERFLNPERQTMPDIDVDFSDVRRDEVIAYVSEKYGANHVAQIITFGTFAQRSLIRELIKVMDVSQDDAYFLLREIPLNSNQSLSVLLKESKELNQYVKNSNKLKLLMMVALQLEGLPRHVSTHAAGVVITERPLMEHVPLTSGQGDIHLTQYAMNDLEAIGLLKMDFLGLRNLTLIERVIHSIYYTTRKKIEIEKIPADDERTYQLLRAGKTNGVFQLESAGMKKVLRQLLPTDFEDVVAVNALYRPGPMDFIPVYIARKHDQEKVIYPHPDLEPILKQTYGVLVYQEQIMQIAHQIADFSLGEADILRRAVSKKNNAVMKQQEKSFIQGCLANGYERTVAEEIFQWIVKFSNYGFPRSHAVAYSMISYQLAYLKANYPANFFAELLSSSVNQQDKINSYINELKQMQIQVLPPSINRSFGKYSVENGHVRMGLSSIKGIGKQAVQEVIDQRKERPFKNLFDFCLRVSFKAVNRTAVENFILAGCFDDLYPNRASLLASIDQAMEQAELFGGFEEHSSFLKKELIVEDAYTELEDFSTIKKLADEKELLGMYVSSHPLKEYRKKLRASGYVQISDLEPLVGQRNITLAVIVQSIKVIRTKRGESMAFVTIGDESGEVDAVVFPDLYRNTNRWLEEELMVFITGKPEVRRDRLQFVTDQFTIFNETELKQTEARRLFIRLTKHNRKESLTKLMDIAKKHPGNVPLLIYDESRNQTYQLNEQYNLTPSGDCLNLLRSIFGKANAVLQE